MHSCVGFICLCATAGWFRIFSNRCISQSMFPMAKIRFFVSAHFWFHVENYTNCFGNHSLLLQSYRTLKPGWGKEGRGRGWMTAEIDATTDCPNIYHYDVIYLLERITISQFLLQAVLWANSPLSPHSYPAQYPEQEARVQMTAVVYPICIYYNDFCQVKSSVSSHLGVKKNTESTFMSCITFNNFCCNA